MARSNHSSIAPTSKYDLVVGMLANTQGVTLGVALHMIEQAFGTTLELSQGEDPSAPAPKKRKIRSLAKLLGGSGADATDSESEDGNLRSRKGTGYSGSAREDVSECS